MSRSLDARPARRRACEFPLLITILTALLAATAGGSPDSTSTATAPDPRSTATGVIAPARADTLPAAVRRSLRLMGSSCTIVADAADTTAAAGGISRAFAEIARLEAVLSSWRKDSELSILNRHGLGMWFICSPDLYAAIDSSIAYADRTHGAFDPTIEALNRAWDLRGKGRVPKPRDLERARMNVGWQNASLDRQRRRVLFHHSDGGVDLGGLGKGYALDRAGATLRRAGTSRALIDFESDALAIGEWKIAVPDPANRARAVLGLVVRDAAVSTASQPEHGVKAKNHRFGHILDPRTGQPVVSNASVTVVSSSATGADALATGFLVMGRDEAAAFVARRPGVGLLWLEPAEGGLRGWKWNLGPIETEPGVTVEWMN